MTLTQQEIEMIELEAAELYPMPDEKLKNLSGYRMAAREIKQQTSAYLIAATKYLLQLKEERERSKKLLGALERVKGITVNHPLRIIIQEAITEYKNNNQ